jgi:hypothetical protein
MIVKVAMDLMQPRLIQKIVDEEIANLNMPVVIQIGLLMIGLAVAGVLGGMNKGVYTAKAVQAFGAALTWSLKSIPVIGYRIARLPRRTCSWRHMTVVWERSGWVSIRLKSV